MAKDTSWAGTDKSGTDLRNLDLRDKVLYRTDVRGAQLYNVGISVSCDTFDGLVLDDQQVGLFLKLIARSDIAQEWKAGLEALVQKVLGQRKSALLGRYLDLHIPPELNA